MRSFFTSVSFAKALLGPVLAVPVLLGDIPGLSPGAENMLAVAIIMAAWWATEAFPLAVTALLPLILLPALGIMPMSQTASSYAHPITFLLLGGFALALAVERVNLHVRAAYVFLSLIRARASLLVAVLMGIAAVSSMWISNTSTTLMLLPVAISITQMIRQHLTDLTPKQLHDFDVSVFLGLAFGATVGGMGTIIGTPQRQHALRLRESHIVLWFVYLSLLVLTHCLSKFKFCSIVFRRCAAHRLKQPNAHTYSLR